MVGVDFWQLDIIACPPGGITLNFLVTGDWMDGCTFWFGLEMMDPWLLTGNGPIDCVSSPLAL